ncbi:hypothetical protein AS188_15040 [Kocuria flava]|uniref:DUF3073 domain-containing protein n=1 Tax=Kocuria flava TaxID=446860 RepID=A0A0U3HI35_9MICC|nr:MULTISPECIES: DUF3073 domain-containing protein [Kocuria]ALU40841.1 hypothetical protein AS188_15040 [Kocuria flava]MCD1146136.1 DUF3073 domain-containing protein [Kocuria sp. LUK]MCJ8503673.1 DUF3073 domain-containing protein [Kocuria flava]PLC12132.1 hypothetical protein AUQ48_07645 [Kocuria flava]GEO93469.1 hypothetical protein KFL01_27750 [Kocuria flava]
MGRGRQKAKATRQAREMKYFSPQTDLTALQKELRGGERSPALEEPAEERFAADEDDYSVYLDKYADDYGDDRR